MPKVRQIVPDSSELWVDLKSDQKEWQNGSNGEEANEKLRNDANIAGLVRTYFQQVGSTA